MNIGIGTTDPKFAMQAVEGNREILRITEDGKAVPGEGLTMQEAIEGVCRIIRYVERNRIRTAFAIHSCPDVGIVCWLCAAVGHIDKIQD